MLELVDITKSFHEGQPNAYTALKNVSLTLERGKVIALHGPSGSGKTTLLTLIGCLARPTSGRVRLDGQDISSLPERFLTALRRERFGFVFQQFNLIAGMSARDNVMVPAYPTGLPYRMLLDRAEEAGLVHLTSNVQVGQFFICNCCKCCCGVLRAINDLKIPARQVVNSHYRAEIDPAICTGCGLCACERCQVGAIEESGDAYRVVPDRCIGCGLCIRHCPVEAMRMVHKDPKDLETPPFTEAEWFQDRGRLRGVDFSPYK